MKLTAQCLVIGGGPAGYGAAWAAGRLGCDVLLVERHGFLGGMGGAASLSAFINYHLDGQCDLSDSAYRDLLGTLRRLGGSYRGDGPHVDFFDVEMLKGVMEEQLSKQGVRLLYHCQFDSAEKTQNGYRLRFVGKGDEVLVCAQYVIDATGDADVCAKLGAPLTYGLNNRVDMMQPMTMVVQLGGFNPQSYVTAGGRLWEGKYACEGCTRSVEIEQARKAGDWTIPRKDIAMWWASPLDPTRVTINGTRIHGYSGCNPLDLTRAEIEGRKQARELATFFRKYVPGFAQSYLLQTGPQIGVRETRRIVGLRTLSTEDVLGGHRPDDSVVYCSYPIDVHSPTGADTEMSYDRRIYYGIPYGCLVPQHLSRVLAAGRCISATHEAAGSFRVMSTCMSIGEAAGTAIALAANTNVDVTDIRGQDVRQVMSKSLNPSTPVSRVKQKEPLQPMPL